MKDDIGGDPISGVKWARRSTRKVAAELRRRGHRISRGPVRRLLKQMDFSLKANVKNLSGPRHPDREEQFEQIGRIRERFQRQGFPVLSVDTKKREIIANYHNKGRVWRQEATEVADHDFPSPHLGRGIPFGIYDVQRKDGFILVGTSAATGSFAVDALRLWHRRIGLQVYPEAKQVLVLCDNGGCNGSTNRLWKYEMQGLADATGWTFHVAHYPPGASKWNPIEHGLFSFISKNWAGQPMTSYEKMLNYIRTTTTETGLTVRAYLVQKKYQKGVKISPEQMEAIHLRPGRVLPKWNYAIRPRPN